MTTKSNTLLSRLTALEAGCPVTLEQLHRLGVSANLAVYYAKSGWLVRLAQGVYARPGTLKLPAALLTLERTILGCHVGGQTALAWYGWQHHVRADAALTLYGWDSHTMPAWFAEPFKAQYRRKRLFAEESGALLSVSRYAQVPYANSELANADFAPMVSEPERAVLEMLSEVGLSTTLDAAKAVMESAYGLRSAALQVLLEHCTSQKTKRLFAQLSKELGLPYAS